MRTYPPPRTYLLVAMVIACIAALIAPSTRAPAEAATSSRAADAAAGGTDVSSVASAAADPTGVWTPVSPRMAKQPTGRERAVEPREFAGYHLNLSALRNRLAKAPKEGMRAAPARITVPAPNGQLVEFDVWETKVMQARLAAKYPQIKTWAGRSVDGVASISLDVTPLGFHAAVRGGEGLAWYLDPVYKGLNQGPDALYASYFMGSLPEPAQGLVEREALPENEVDHDEHGHEDGEPEGKKSTAERVGETPGSLVKTRTYRLALVTDDGYARYHTKSTNPAEVNKIVTAAKATLVNRVNQVYGDDLSIRLLLVNATERINLNTEKAMYSPNGRCGSQACFTKEQGEYCTGGILTQNRLALGQLVGAENYDVGHMVLGGPSGGLAMLFAVGFGVKGMACTALRKPVGDYFAIEYLAHELGHQFNADHSFNGAAAACDKWQRANKSAVEPGSGSTIMSYAGLCNRDNLQKHSDPYFSQRSRTDILKMLNFGNYKEKEITDISLSGFGNGESLSIHFKGSKKTAVIQRGRNYTAAGIKAAVEAAEPSKKTVSVKGFWGGNDMGPGFRLKWDKRAAVNKPTVKVKTGKFKVQVGTTDQGGLTNHRGKVTTTGNRSPVVKARAAVTIPKRTPFVLTGTATDPNGDPLTYMWEQNDPGTGTKLTDNAKPSGPLFRVFGTATDVTDKAAGQSPSPGQNNVDSNPTRYFPDLAQVLGGHTNALTGRCPEPPVKWALPLGPVLECYSEFLPTSARDLNFRLTARDHGGTNGGSDGGVSYADTKVKVSELGPFLVTSQPSSTQVTAGETGTITWTSGMSSLAANVKISLSTDGGVTFDHVLAESTPNNGSATITWPNVDTSKARIKIEGLGNIFYAVNRAPITITAGG